MRRLALLLALVGTLASAPAAAAPAPSAPAAAGAASRAELGAELERVAARIELLKADPRRGLLGEEELKRLLARSQELAERLTALDREESAARDRARAEAGQRLRALEKNLETARAALAAAPPERRAAALEAVRAAHERLEEARAALGADAGTARVPGGAPLPPSDDPEELRQQADLLRDDRDRIRTRIAELDARIAEAREQAEVERELRDLEREGALLHEEDRTLSIRRETRIVGPDGAPSIDGRPRVVEGSLGPSPGDRRAGLAPLGGGESAAELEARRKALLELDAELAARVRTLEAKARSAGGR